MRPMAWVTGTAAVLASILLTAAAPAAARTSGKERFRGVVIATNQGGQRQVVSGWVVGLGVLDASARIVEVASQPGDPDNVVRDDLVFPSGTIHIVTTNAAPRSTVDPRTCAYSVRVRQTTEVAGGTRRFRNASGSFRGTLRDWGVAARAADGSCDQQQEPLLDVAEIATRGRLSF